MGKSLRQQHRDLWQWLADNPSKEKIAWPGWKSTKNSKAFATACFACAKVNKIADSCSSCPCDFGVARCHCACLQPYATYYLWREARGPRRKELALQIKNCWPKNAK